MKKDLILGVAVSILVHAGVLFGLGDGGATDREVIDEVPTIELVEMPQIEPEPPEQLMESAQAEEVPLEFAPPMQAEVPGTVTVNSFVQPMQPPPPPSASISKSAVTIPVDRTPPVSKLTNVFNIEDLDRPPRRTKTVPPVFPLELKRARVQGEVLLIVLIDPNGFCTVERVAESTAREFVPAAIAAAEQCVFESPTKGGQAVHARYSMRVPFRIQ